VVAVNAEGSFGRWHYAVVKRPEEIPRVLENLVMAADWPGLRQAE
jgi:hypothetical protein